MLSGLVFNSLTYYLGLYVLSRSLFILIQGLYPLIFSHFRPTDYLARYGKGSFALITGASDGFGKAFAHHLAQLGFNLVLVARNKEKLEGVKKEIKAKKPLCDVRIIVKDFTNALEKGFFDDFETASRDLDISILVNNVGISSATMDMFENYMTSADYSKIREMIVVNMVSQAALHRIFSANLNSRKNRSAIFDVASIGARVCAPISDIYFSTKDFNRSLTANLSSSERMKNIDYVGLNLGGVKSNFSDHSFLKKFGKIGISSEDAVLGAIKSLGIVRESSGNIKHVFENLVANLVGESLDEYTSAALSFGLLLTGNIPKVK